ncbi:MAG: cyclic pyranopterin monophosphate synthase MoaC [Verrucomicrobia bacterium]|nr:cyclic pyranopterin monophosphate synthase MoaC [Verrucomicrobiota bacterium]
MLSEFSHIASDGRIQMVDVSAKQASKRVAIASAFIFLQSETIAAVESNAIGKGNVLLTAQIAGIQAAKRTDELIPLCHSLPIQHAEIEFGVQPNGIAVSCRTTTTAQTGVEMESLIGATVAALTIYDMCKAVDKAMVISEVKLVSKTKT